MLEQRFRARQASNGREALQDGRGNLGSNEVALDGEPLPLKHIVEEPMRFLERARVAGA